MALPSLKNINKAISVLSKRGDFSWSRKERIRQAPKPTFGGLLQEKVFDPLSEILSRYTPLKSPRERAMLGDEVSFETKQKAFQIYLMNAMKKKGQPEGLKELSQSYLSDISTTALGFLGGGKIPFVKKTTPIQQVINALKKAKPVRAKQELLYTVERGRRIAKSLEVGKKVKGEAGFFAEKAALKGKMPKVQFDSIKNSLGKTVEERQSVIDSLFIQVKENPLLSNFEKITAREGLAKMFDGSVPTGGELSLLNNVFGEEFVNAVKSNLPFWKRAGELGYEVANIPRALMASFDVSAPLRQGAFFIGKPKQFVPSFGNMFKYLVSEKGFKGLQKEISSRPTFNLMKEAKLDLSAFARSLTQREEAFMSNLAEKIPIIGRFVRASDRAYTGFLTKLRADVFDDLVNKAISIGKNPYTDTKFTKQLADYINVATGRGKKLAGAIDIQKPAKFLNTFFFSPKLMASRTTLLNPLYYVKLDPFIRKDAIKSLLTFSGTALSILGLAGLAGAKVGKDIRSSDFGKIKIGNTRIDIGAGFQQYLRMFGQLYTGEYVSSTTGKLITLGEGYKPLTRLDILTKQIEAKESPLFSLLTNLLRQQDFKGQPVNLKNEVAQRFIPMFIQDIIEVAKDNPNLLPIASLGAFGVGIQTYGEEDKKQIKKMGLPSLKGL